MQKRLICARQLKKSLLKKVNPTILPPLPATPVQLQGTLGHLAHSCGFRPKLHLERVAPMTVGVPCQPGQREPFEEAVKHARAHRAERIPIQAHSPTRTPRPSQQRHRPDKLQGQAKGEIHQHLHRWKLGPMLVTARFVRTVEHDRIKRRYLEMTKSEEIDELKTRIRARASDSARPAQSIIERVLAAPTTTRRMKAFERSH